MDALSIKRYYESNILSSGAVGVAVSGDKLIIMVQSEDDIPRVRSEISPFAEGVNIEYKVVGKLGAR